MEVRAYFGRFVTAGQDSAPMSLQVILSTSGGVTSGSGDFEVPAALVGFLRQEDALTFRTEAGEEFAVVVREVDVGEGHAYFLTRGALPAGQVVKVA